LPVWFDVDTPDDLERLRAALPADGVAGAAPETTRLLESWRRPRQSDTPWRTISSRPVYANKWIAVREDFVALPDGRTTIYGVVSCGQCVGLLPFLDPDTVLPSASTGTSRDARRGRCRRAAFTRETLEAAAQREFAEESGYRAGRLVRVSTYHEQERRRRDGPSVPRRGPDARRDGARRDGVH
jgi:hypothetical protein